MNCEINQQKKQVSAKSKSRTFSKISLSVNFIGGFCYCRIYTLCSLEKYREVLFSSISPAFLPWQIEFIKKLQSRLLLFCLLLKVNKIQIKVLSDKTVSENDVNPIQGFSTHVYLIIIRQAQFFVPHFFHLPNVPAIIKDHQ